jgi:short subunit dehydrogenase-like uncharacterized protein
MKPDFLLYGSYGYTGDLVARLAVERGLRPLLSGRDPVRLKKQADELGLEWRAISLDDSPALDAALKETGLVLHCAGPFAFTSRQMVEACLRMGAHYLDITGEIQVFETLAGTDSRAKQAGVMLLPGIGFDVVPSDCLAAHLKNRLPDADRLTLAIRGLGGISHGTMFTGLNGLGTANQRRVDGALVDIPGGVKSRLVDFGRGPVEVTAMSWGDISTAFYSTGIPNIEVYMKLPPNTVRLMGMTRIFGGLMTSAPVQALLRGLVRQLPPGPTAEQRQKGLSLLWGEVSNAQGERVSARLQTPEAYQLTALTSVAAVQKILSGQVAAGFKTPSLAFGADFILEIESVVRTDLES